MLIYGPGKSCITSAITSLANCKVLSLPAQSTSSAMPHSVRTLYGPPVHPNLG
eukprot:TRINITY_DN32155_c0_g1_i1.p4 TRINITY_DN32155_c0_g1~~TRINITY_DN32155_c0_g1_i1.p4  ORF type:complete len:53 (+),score=0.17 TRINITY_DN32155_c0_g1_i1:53-211(+)